MTSSITTNLLRFDHTGNVLNVEFNDHCINDRYNTMVGASRRLRSYSDLELSDETITNKIVSLTDCAGHEKFLKTTVKVLATRKTDHCLLTISAARNRPRSSSFLKCRDEKVLISDMTGEHLGLIAGDFLFYSHVTKFT